jgi:hypothetical protein
MAIGVHCKLLLGFWYAVNTECKKVKPWFHPFIVSE